jgi:hypothetical protein
MPVGALLWRLRNPHREPVRACDGDEVAGTHPSTVVERAFEEKRLRTLLGRSLARDVAEPAIIMRCVA